MTRVNLNVWSVSLETELNSYSVMSELWRSCLKLVDVGQHELSPHPVAKQIIMSHLWPGPSSLSYLFWVDPPPPTASPPAITIYFYLLRRILPSQCPHCLSGAGTLISWLHLEPIWWTWTISINRPKLNIILTCLYLQQSCFITVLESTKKSDCDIWYYLTPCAS